MTKAGSGMDVLCRRLGRIELSGLDRIQPPYIGSELAQRSLEKLIEESGDLCRLPLL